MKRLRLQLVVLLNSLAFVQMLYASNFKAYYTRLPIEDEISDKHADIIVQLDRNQQFIFSRESSYLPYLFVDGKKYFVKEVIDRYGDGNKTQPDKYNRHSYVRIIENSSVKALIHWRYYPDFLKVEMTDVVHEFFTILPDGNVKREIKTGTEKIGPWNSATNVRTQQLQLTDRGIKIYSETEPSVKTNSEKVSGIEKKSILRENLAAYWPMDEGIGDITKEEISNLKIPIAGHKSYWISGVSGTALKFDGYFSGISLPVQYSPKVAYEFTIEAWIVMAAHPFGWVPIIQQAQWNNNGYYLGINAYGQIGFHLNIDRKWQTILVEEKIELKRWTHVAVTLSDESKKIIIYIDGEPRKTKTFKAENDPPLIHANAPLTIGLNHDPLIPLPRERFTYGQYPCITGLEGAIDEITIYNNELSAYEIKKSYDRLKPIVLKDAISDFEKRILPGHSGYADKFGAAYTKFKYHDLWDNTWRTSDYPDILVKFDELPTSVTFWRGPSYGAGWVTENNLWMVDQSVESGNAVSYGEHMSDKQGRYSHVRLIENSDARVVIHWRYSASDVLYSFFKHYGDAGVWIDEYMTIYPDGVGIRKVKQKALSQQVKHKTIDWEERKVNKISWQDVQFLAQPGMTPDDVMNLEAVHLANLKGETATMDWSNGVPSENPLPDANIERINMKSEYKVFLAFQEGTFINPWGRVQDEAYSHFMTWNHWPVAFINSQGKRSLFPDRATHSALCAADNAVDHGNMAMYGFTNKGVDSLLPLVKSWCNPPEISDLSGANKAAYDKDQRAYIIDKESDKISFVLNGSEKTPVHNVCLVIKNWSDKNNAALLINDKKMEKGKSFRQGIVYDTNGNETLILWYKLNSTKPVSMKIEKE
ncbi:MAG: LamG domain-containing protein [Candidatus Marinimicrobia bacterium]|jgi:hypothetical protein|nr:LamG domain-containing protein [Candidatus Neomarinimicrobiota bacterium]|tara:strand:- start:560 stop:3178 length:2619 start_codon:yes stop_codon:yes gene_type:complete